MNSFLRCALRVGTPLLCANIVILAITHSAHANHGPGASGGGSSTISGETLKEKQWELSLREDFTQFQHFDQTAAEGRAAVGGDFDALHRGYITTVDVAYGLTNDLQLGASIGYFKGEDFISSSLQDDDSIDTGFGNPDGLTDLTLTAKYRFYRGPLGSFSVLGGVKAPTGRNDVTLSNGERLSPTDQPGTGTWDVPVGIAWSRFLTSKLTADASAMYTVRTRAHGFQVGDRLDVGAALAYRITEQIDQFPQVSVFGEALMVFLQKDRDNGESDPNSGSATVYLSPGLRLRFTKNLAFTVAPAFPVFQQVNGDQGKVEFKTSISMSLSF